MTDAPIPSPRPPDDSAPLSLDQTPSQFPVTAAYVQRKLAEAGQRPRWTPDRSTPFWAAVFVGTVSASGPFLMNENFNWRVVLASALMGASTSMAMFFGMRSSGPHR